MLFFRESGFTGTFRGFENRSADDVLVVGRHSTPVGDVTPTRNEAQ